MVSSGGYFGAWDLILVCGTYFWCVGVCFDAWGLVLVCFDEWNVFLVRGSLLLCAGGGFGMFWWCVQLFLVCGSLLWCVWVGFGVF